MVFKDINGIQQSLVWNNLYNADCLEAMRAMPDNFADIAIVDPPYGGGATENGGGGGMTSGCTKSGHGFGGRFDKYEIKATRTGGTWATKYGNDITHWDIAPPPEYFEELFRVSKHQIIFGGNYFALPPTRCFCVWRKLTISESFSMAMAEYIWTSYSDNAKWIEMAPQGTKNEPRSHPCCKPVNLYAWLLNLFAKPSNKILDTHVGSGNSLIACIRADCEYMGFEIDDNYFKGAIERINKEKQQMRLTVNNKSPEYKQLSLIESG